VRRSSERAIAKARAALASKDREELDDARNAIDSTRKLAKAYELRARAGGASDATIGSTLDACGVPTALSLGREVHDAETALDQK
jgi:hypothetical protein